MYGSAAVFGTFLENQPLNLGNFLASAMQQDQTEPAVHARPLGEAWGLRKLGDEARQMTAHGTHQGWCAGRLWIKGEGPKPESCFDESPPGPQGVFRRITLQVPRECFDESPSRFPGERDSRSKGVQGDLNPSPGPQGVFRGITLQVPNGSK